MLHACLYTICFVFCYTSWCFYAFSGTNLLTRCHSASSLFSAVFVFQKSYTGNILGIARNKSRSSYFLDMRRSPKQRRRGTRGQPHHRVARPAPGPRHWWCGVDVGVLYITTQLETPREGYDEHNSKSSFSMKPRFIELVGERTNFRRLMLASFATAPDNGALSRA
jgi:hypothetical protein